MIPRLGDGNADDGDKSGQVTTCLENDSPSRGRKLSRSLLRRTLITSLENDSPSRGRKRSNTRLHS